MAAKSTNKEKVTIDYKNACLYTHTHFHKMQRQSVCFPTQAFREAFQLQTTFRYTGHSGQSLNNKGLNNKRISNEKKNKNRFL